MPPGEESKNKTEHTWARTPIYLVCKTGHTADISQGLLSLEIPDASDGAQPGTHATPVAVPPVLAGSQIKVSAHVVRLLVHEPLTVHHVAGLEIRHVEAVHEVGAIIHELHHSATHVRTFIEPHPEGAAMLTGEEQKVKGDCLISPTVFKWEHKC